MLPFQNISGDPEQEYFTDGMVEDIITGLSRINWLFVIARNSSFAYKGKAIDIKQVGRELGVRYVLEGSVRKGGNRLRITGQLIEAETGTHVWADRYDGVLEDVFDLQDRITETIVGIIEPSVRRAEIERARRKRPDNLDAYDLYLRALPHTQSAMPEDASIAIGLSRRGAEARPRLRGGPRGPGRCATRSRFRGGGFDEADRTEGVRHARLALALGTDDAAALAIAAITVLHLARDFEAASGAIARALSLNGSCATALYWGAHIHGCSGDPALAEDYANRALRLSPFDPLQLRGPCRPRRRAAPPRALRRRGGMPREGGPGEPALQRSLRACRRRRSPWPAASRRRRWSPGGSWSWSRPSASRPSSNSRDSWRRTTAKPSRSDCGKRGCRSRDLAPFS